MATVFSYPGVYLAEVESSVRPIVGVPTSIAAFVGLALRGPKTAETINTWTDFESQYGGLWTASEMSYAVYQFFLNGGSQAIIVRVGADPAYSELDLAADAKIRALASGTAGKFTTTVKHDANNKSYALTVTAGSVTETYAISIDPAARTRQLDLALATSRLVAWVPPAPTTPPTPAAGPTTLPDEVTDKLSSAAADVALAPADVTGDSAAHSGIYALHDVDLFNLLIIPFVAPTDKDADWAPVIDAAAVLCEQRRAMLLLDPPLGWDTLDKAVIGAKASLPVTGFTGRNAAVFFPRISISDPAGGADRVVGPAGTVAGVFARTDAARGVWKAPAGIDAVLRGARSLTVALTDAENGELNPIGVNCLRKLPVYGYVLWGSRTCRGNDEIGDPWKYVPVRRIALFIEETLFRATKWVVFEPNDEPLWSSLRLNIGAFMDGLFRQGAFQGSTAREAYFVKCDAENNPQSDIDLGIVNIDVGFQPLKPAEFVRIRIQQKRPDPA